MAAKKADKDRKGTAPIEPGYDLEALRQEAAERQQSFISTMAEADRHAIFGWYDIPYEMQDYVFVRCGIKGTEAAEALANKLRKCGYFPAPRRVKCRGCEEDDGEYGLYLCIHPEEKAKLDRAKAEAQDNLARIRRQQNSLDDLKAQLGPRAQIEVKEEQGRGSYDQMRQSAGRVGRG